MSKKLVFVVMLVVSCFIASAVSLTVTWCPSPSTNIGAYKIYYIATNKVAGWKPTVYANGTNCPPGAIISNGTNWVRNYTTNVLAGLSNTYILRNVSVGKTYYIAATSVDTNSLLESDFSEEAELTVTNLPPSAPTNLQIIDVK